MAAAAPPSTGSATPVAAPAVPGASRDPAAMTGVSAGDRGSGRPEAAVRPDQVQLGVSASVGHDHWANDVLSAVEEQKEEAAAAAATSSEESPVVQETTATALSPAAKVLERKRKFHSGRALELKNLPDGCTEQDIRDALPDLSILSVSIDQTDGRYKAGARLSLAKPELLDEWPKARQNVFVKNKEVSVCVGASEGWLCVAKLPLDYTDEQFERLAAAYGRVREAFLMVNKDGESKGYGLIKYESSDAAAQAKQCLDGHAIVTNSLTALECDWLNHSHISFASLNSKALYVEGLPPNYRDMAEFRRIFSVIRNPPFCQFAITKGVIQDWGLVEFFDPADTEETQSRRNGYVLRGHRLRVHYCIPGVNAMKIHMQMQAVNAPATTKKKALLNDTPSANVYSQLQKLAQQNPNFAQNLQTIIQDQIQSLSSGRPSPSRQECVSSSGATTGVAKTTPSAPNVALASTPAANSNAQAALMILLTAQMQSQTGGDASLLQNPQVVNVLQSLVGNGAATAQQSPSNINELLSNPALSPVFGGQVAATMLDQMGEKKEGATVPSSPMVANNLNNLLNTQNLNQLLGSLNAAVPQSATSVSTSSTVNPTLVKTPSTASFHQQQIQQQQQYLQQQHLVQQQPPPRPVLLGDLTPMARPLLPAPTAAASLGPPAAAAAPLLMAPPHGSLFFAGLSAAFTQHQQQLYPQQQQQMFPQSLLGYNPAAFQFSPYAAAAAPTVATTSTGFMTPPPTTLGKRKLPIPPSPEQSPEGNYIGQHSQGLGGHYADSYWRKRSKFE